MTCIALDRTHIAWDSQITMGDEKVSWAGEKVWIVDKAIYAFAGDFAYLDPVIEWHRKGARPRLAPEGEWEMLFITSRGANLFAHDMKYPTAVTAPFAMGTGAAYARGAMLARASAYRAVKIACMCDVYSGGEVGVLKLEDVFKVRSGVS